jgi:glucose-6-phosphate dehydrogenase assembly protein OpcA
LVFGVLNFEISLPLMPALVFNALPGIEVPVGSISKSLAKMWADTAAQGGPAPAAEQGKATQVNFVLHLGYNTTDADAAEQFQTAVRFSRRYPCRVVVLCPLPPDDPATELRAKIYGECHLGKSKGDTRCCEFVMLTYPQVARQFLENQVSVCLSTDLPTYYWAHRFSSSARLNDYQYLLKRATRVIFDSALVPADALTFPWPRPDAVRDLVYARLLPVRQSIGQFLSGFAPDKLTAGLKNVRVSHRESVAAEGRVLLGWLTERLVKCGASPTVNYTSDVLSAPGADSLELYLEYADGRYFHWRGDLAKGRAHFAADLGTGPTTLPTAVTLLSPEAALGEAMFF